MNSSDDRKNYFCDGMNALDDGKNDKNNEEEMAGAERFLISCFSRFNCRES